MTDVKREAEEYAERETCIMAGEHHLIAKALKQTVAAHYEAGHAAASEKYAKVVEAARWALQGAIDLDEANGIHKWNREEPERQRYDHLCEALASIESFKSNKPTKEK